MPAMWLAGGSALAGIGGGLLGASGANRQIQAMKAAIEEQRRQYDATQARLAPFVQAGSGQINNLTNLLNNPATSSYIDPGFQFRRDQGMKTITGNSASNGLIQSGDTLRALETYGQDMGSQEYNNAFNRYMGQVGATQNAVNMGEGAAADTGSLTQQAMNNIGNMTANTNFGGPLQVGAQMLGGAAGMGMNAFASRFNQRPAMDPLQAMAQKSAGSNIMGTIANDNMNNG